MAFKKAKIKPVRIARPPRGAGGRFVTKTQVKGTADIKRFFAVLKESAFEVARKEVRGIAEAAREELVERIEKQNVPNMGGTRFGKPRRFSTPLHPFTLRQKEKKGQDPRTLIATGAYVNAIGVIETKKGKGYTYSVGLTEETHPGGLPMEQLGRILEYGARIRVTPKMRAYLHWRGLHLKKETEFITIPSRPHWGPVFLCVRREVRKLQKWANANLTKELKKRLRAAR